MKSFKIQNDKYEWLVEKKGKHINVKPIVEKTKNKKGGSDVRIIMPPLTLINELNKEK